MVIAIDSIKYSTVITSAPSSTVNGKKFDSFTTAACEGETQKWMIATIRYLDKYLKYDGKGLFAKRKLMVDWIENH